MELIIVAAGGLAREAATVAEQLPDWELLGYLDDEPALKGTEVSGRPVLGDLVAVRDHPEASLLVCAGKGSSRRAIVRRLRELGVTDERYATLVAPGVQVPASCAVGRGSVLLSGTVLTADVSVGAHVVIMPGVILTHDDQVHDFATLCARVTLGGSVIIGVGAYLGMGSAVRERVEVGAGSVLGMGAVLLRDLPGGETWVGSPAANLLRSPTFQEKKS